MVAKQTENEILEYQAKEVPESEDLKKDPILPSVEVTEEEEEEELEEVGVIKGKFTLKETEQEEEEEE